MRATLALLWIGHAVMPPIGFAQYAERVRWPLVDVLVRADSTGQLELLAAPNLASRQGHEWSRHIDRLRPRPIDALQWATLMRRIVDSLAAIPGRLSYAMLAPALGGPHQTSRVYLGLSGEKRKPFRFVVEPDARDRAWQATADAAEIRKLLDAVGQAASYVMRPDTPRLTRAGESACPIPMAGDGAAADSDVDRTDGESPGLLNPEVLEFPLLANPREGRVWLQFRIDPAGSVTDGSACILLTDGEPFSAALRWALPKLRYRPATKAGVPLECLMFQEFRFVYRRR